MSNKSLGKNAIFSIAYKVLNVVFPIISMAYVSRVLLSDGIGRINAVSNNSSYFLILATLGIPAHGLLEVAKTRSNKAEMNRTYSELFYLNAVMSLISYFLYMIIILTCSYFQKERYLYIIYGISIILNIINIDWLYQGLEEYAYITIRSTVIKLISIVALFIFIKTKKDVYIYAIIQLVATSGNRIFNLIRTKSYVKLTFDNICIKRHLKPLLYLALCSVSTELYAKMDITMLDIISNSNTVGYYTNSQKLINLSIITLVAVTAVFMPRLGFLFENDKKEFNRILNIGFDIVITFSLPACLGMMMISKPLVLTFFGIDFIEASNIVLILSLMIPLKSVGDLICFQVLMCAGQEKILMKSYFFTMLINLINNTLLIPRYGAVGAAIASVISEIVANAFCLFYSRKYFKLSYKGDVIIKTLIGCLVMVFAILPISFINISAHFKLVSELLVGIAMFLVVCYITKQEVVLKYTNYLLGRIKIDS